MLSSIPSEFVRWLPQHWFEALLIEAAMFIIAITVATITAIEQLVFLTAELLATLAMLSLTSMLEAVAMPMVVLVVEPMPVITMATLESHSHSHRKLWSILTVPPHWSTYSIYHPAEFPTPLADSMFLQFWQLQRLHHLQQHHQLGFPRPPSSASLLPCPRLPSI